MSEPSGSEAAQQAASDAVADAAPGTQASAQTQGEIDNPHGGHTDSWVATKQDDGSVSVDKSHTYGDDRDN